MTAVAGGTSDAVEEFRIHAHDILGFAQHYWSALFALYTSFSDDGERSGVEAAARVRLLSRFYGGVDVRMLVAQLDHTGASANCLGFRGTADERAHAIKLLRSAYDELTVETEQGGGDIAHDLARASAVNALMLAVKGGDIDKIKAILTDFADIDLDEPDAMEETLLSHAVKNGHIKAVELLLERGCNVDQPASMQNLTCLFLAIKQHRLDIARMILAKGADTNAIDMQGQTLLSVACTTGDAAFVEELLDNGADMHQLLPNGMTLVMAVSVAKGKGATDMLKLLLRRGAPIDAVNKNGYSAVMMAAGDGLVDNCMLLLEHGATVDMCGTNNKATGLHLSLMHGHIEIGEALLRRGLNLKGKTKNGFTPLHYVADKHVVKRLKAAEKEGKKFMKQQSKKKKS